MDEKSASEKGSSDWSHGVMRIEAEALPRLDYLRMMNRKEQASGTHLRGSR